MPVVGLTGGIATGKSLVTRYLKERGVMVIDADQLSRQVVTPGEPALREIVHAFGSDILRTDGTLDRGKLGKLIFDFPDERKKLEAIIHPKVYERAWLEIRGLLTAQPDRWVVFSVPLLFESGHAGEVDQVVLVYTDRETQIDRLMARDGLLREEAKKRIVAQMPIEAKKARAHIVIDNSGTVTATYRQVDGLLTQWSPL
jgi:dephospho-CoA kinase